MNLTQRTGNPIQRCGSIARRRVMTGLLPMCLLALAIGLLDQTPGAADDTPGDAAAGYRLLTEQPLLPSDFGQETFDQLWTAWPKALRDRAAEASLAQRRVMAFERYGLTSRPGHVPGPDGDPGPPLQYVVDASGAWTMNCFSCHGGQVDGRAHPGAPNNRFALQTLTEEIRGTKFRTGVPWGRMELGSMIIPLGTTHGTTNAVVFGMGLMHYRDADLNVIDRAPAAFTHHDMDAPAWWHFRKKPAIYIDGFAQKGHRGLMQFTLVPENDAAFYRDNEAGFRDVYAYLESLRAPKYPGAVDQTLATAGQRVFENNCSACHGTYGTDWTYPNQAVPIEELGTDPVRLTALPPAGRQLYADSWFAHAGQSDEQTTVIDPVGYVAPPLDGIWASAPYLHNGSVPTLAAMLDPATRPAVWRPTGDRDDVAMGLEIEVADRVPVEHPDAGYRRQWFDTRRFGKSNAGHDYPAELDPQQRRAVLEYLKTL